MQLETEEKLVYRRGRHTARQTRQKATLPYPDTPARRNLHPNRRESIVTSAFKGMASWIGWNSTENEEGDDNDENEEGNKELNEQQHEEEYQSVQVTPQELERASRLSFTPSSLNHEDERTEDDEEDEDESDATSSIATSSPSRSKVVYNGTILSIKTTRMKQLKSDLRSLGLSTEGRKQELLTRLKEHVIRQRHLHETEMESKEFADTPTRKANQGKKKTSFCFDNVQEPIVSKIMYRKTNDVPVSDSGFPFNRQTTASTASSGPLRGVVSDNGMSNNNTASAQSSSNLFQSIATRKSITPAEYAEMNMQLKSMVNTQESSMPPPPCLSSAPRESIRKDLERMTSSDDSFDIHSGQSIVPVSQWTGPTSSSLFKAPPPSSFTYVPGQFNVDPRARRRPEVVKRTLQVQDVVAPTSKRPRYCLSNRSSHDLPPRTSSSQPYSCFRPRPSKFLTGNAQRNHRRSNPNLYSNATSATCQRIMKTLSEMSTPLEEARSKPAPTPALAWQKYGASLRRDLPVPPQGNTMPSSVPPPRVMQTPVPVQMGQPLSTRPVQELLASPVQTPKPFSKNLPSQMQAATAPPKSRFTFSQPKANPTGPEKSLSLKNDVQYLFSPPKLLAPKLIKTPGKAIKKVVITAPPPSNVAPPQQRSTPTVPSVMPPAVAMDGSNPLARFMTASDSWKCSACCVSNPQELNTCPCCETPRPSGGSSNSKKPKALDSLMFGASSETKSTAPSSSFSFGVIPKSEMEEKKSTTSSFSFGVQPLSATTPSSSFVNGTSVEAPTKSSFSFGVSAPQEVSKPVVSFGFGVPSKAAEPSAASTFSFGIAAATPAEDKKSVVLQLPTKSATKDTTPALSFGVAASSSDESKKSAFSFGVTPSTDIQPKEDATVSSAFSFGVNTTTTQPTTESKPNVGFSFAPPTPSAATTAPTSNAFNGVVASGPGGPVVASGLGGPVVPSDSKPEKTPFSFGGPETTTQAVKSTNAPFSFGATPSAEATKPPVSSGFAFAAPTATSTPVVDVTSAAAAPFSFGATTPSAAAPANGFTSASFGATPAGPSTSTPFAFGGTPSLPQGNAPGGPNSFSFGAATPEPTNQFSMNESPPVSQASMSSSAMPSFGGPPASTGFGGPVSTGFNGAPASTGFGGPPTSTSFGGAPSSTSFGGAPPSTSFGGAPSASTGFGAPQAPTNFGGAPPASNGFAAPPSSGFGTSNPFSAPINNVGFPAPPPSFGAAPASQPTPFAFAGGPPSFVNSVSAPGPGSMSSAPPSSGFSIGAAPKTRRIVKARRPGQRSKR